LGGATAHAVGKAGEFESRTDEEIDACIAELISGGKARAGEGAQGTKATPVKKRPSAQDQRGSPTAMKPPSLPIGALAATAISSAHAAKPSQIGDSITLQVQTLACFDLENTKELERTRAEGGRSAAIVATAIPAVAASWWTAITREFRALPMTVAMPKPW
jgi:hypothetical protein